jgi:hypothetical protein
MAGFAFFKGRGGRVKKPESYAKKFDRKNNTHESLN